jgi:methylmalonyl-CoA mutase cobalamin-binding domain/chain
MQDSNLETLELSVVRRDTDLMRRALDNALGESIQRSDIRSALLRGLEHVRHQVMSEVPLPEFLLCLDVVTEGLNRTKLSEEKRTGKNAEIVMVIGVVESDPHDLGKNMIAAIYRSEGYKVIDLGNGVPNKDFVESVITNKAKILALSAMMSTTMIAMPEIIREVKSKSPHTRVMVGGACLDRSLAESYGADGYAESAVTVLEETEAALQGF